MPDTTSTTKVVLITGPQGHRRRRRRLAPMGAKLALIDLDAEEVDARGEVDGEAEPFVADVSERDSIASAIAAAASASADRRRAASAGISGTPQPATLVSDEEFRARHPCQSARRLVDALPG